jgi:hypothetical protein
MQALHSVRIWRDRVRDAMRTASAGLAPAASLRG